MKFALLILVDEFLLLLLALLDFGVVPAIERWRRCGVDGEAIRLLDVAPRIYMVIMGVDLLVKRRWRDVVFRADGAVVENALRADMVDTRCHYLFVRGCGFI